ncbi:unnamed protein product [Calypogeia fissa]
MRGNSNALVVSEKASRLPVDHRLPLRIYYRAADSLLRQARIYRKENNLIDLYVLLLRFSSLVMETIPQHRDYRIFLGREKPDFRKRLLDVLSELETLKPLVRSEVSRYNNVHAPASTSSNGLASSNAFLARSHSLPLHPPVKELSKASYNWEVPAKSNPYDSNKQEYSSAGYNWQGDLSSKPADLLGPAYPQSGYSWTGDLTGQAVPSGVQHSSQTSYNGVGDLNGRPADSRGQEYSQGGYSLSGHPSSRPVYSGALLPPYSSPASSTIDDRMSKLSFSIPTPTSDSLSRHSFLGPTVRKATVSNILTSKVKYPSLIDSSPSVIPSLDQSWQTPEPVVDSVKSDPVFYNEADMIKFEEKHSSLVDSAVALHSQLNMQPCPPPVEAEVHHVTVASLPSHENGCTGAHLSDVLVPPAVPMKFSEDSVQSREPKQLHISVSLMDSFMRVASGNTRENLETCGVLAGSLKEGVFYVTTLIIPKQEATANSCSTLNEEDIFEFQDKHDLFQFGWIHTHPSQKCFMSSIDLHTHYSYQVMLPEAVAIVMAPTDSSRKFGIFRLAEPNGIKVIQSCDQRGFHPHSEPVGGGSIYEQCGHVHLDSKIKCDVVDLR